MQIPVQEVWAGCLSQGSSMWSALPRLGATRKGRGKDNAKPRHLDRTFQLRLLMGTKGEQRGTTAPPSLLTSTSLSVSLTLEIYF